MPLLELECDGKSLDFDVRRLICAGYAGRNRDQVQRHIDELKLAGVPAPKEVPTKYVVPANLLTLSDEITVSSRSTSGEVEYVILFDDSGEKYVGVGSDHTDREIEKTDVAVSKAICPKPMSKIVWRYDDVSDHWDHLTVSSFAFDGGKLVNYQNSTLDYLLTPNDLLSLLKEWEPGTAVCGGTVPLENGFLPNSPRFSMRLFDPLRNRTLEHSYSIHVRS